MENNIKEQSEIIGNTITSVIDSIINNLERLEKITEPVRKMEPSNDEGQLTSVNILYSLEAINRRLIDLLDTLVI